jgi:putative DNA primase/helicase
MTPTEQEMLDVARQMVEDDKQRESNGNANDSESDTEITRLAKLSISQYEHERKDAAETLGMRASILDKLVEAERLRLNPNDDGKQGHAISLPEPEPWPDPVDGALLLKDISEAVRKHVVVSDAARDIATLWILHTHLIDRFLVSPRLCVRSPTKGCGKTTLLDVLARLVPRPLSTANCSTAALFRVMEGHHPTLMVDEADTFLRDNDELRGVLNGNRQGSSVLRTIGDDFEVRAFATYGAVAIALIGSLPDTLHDRSVVMELKRKLKTETVAPFRPDRAGYLDVLTRKAARWTQDNAEAIADADPTMPDGIINREADNWRPLLAIAGVAAGDWPERARNAAIAAHAAAGEDEASRLELLLGDIRAISRGKIQMPSADLVKALVEMEGRPWAELGKQRKPLTQNGLAHRLKPLGITSGTIRVGDKTPKGYTFKHLEEAFARYLPEEGGSEPPQRHNADEMGTSEPFQSATRQPDVAVQKYEKPNNDGHCGGVADGKGEGQGDEPSAPTNGQAGIPFSRKRANNEERSC